MNNSNVDFASKVSPSDKNEARQRYINSIMQKMESETNTPVKGNKYY